MSFPLRHDDSPNFAEWTNDELRAQMADWWLRLQHAEQVYDLLYQEAQRRHMIRRELGWSD